jgi:hypothetical protein
MQSFYLLQFREGPFRLPQLQLQHDFIVSLFLKTQFHHMDATYVVGETVGAE